MSLHVNSCIEILKCLASGGDPALHHGRIRLSLEGLQRLVVFNCLWERRGEHSLAGLKWGFSVTSSCGRARIMRTGKTYEALFDRQNTHTHTHARSTIMPFIYEQGHLTISHKKTKQFKH